MAESEAGGLTQTHRIGRLTTSLGADVLVLTSLSCEERLSEPFTLILEAFSEAPSAIHTLLGTRITVAMETDLDFQKRWFSGMLWEYEELGRDERGYNYRLVARPSTEFLTLNCQNSIFQQQSVVQIAKKLLQSCTIVDKLSGTYEAIEYCVQYQESDWHFLSRLLEYNGIYYFYEHGDGSDKIVLIDDRNSHEDLDPAAVDVTIDSDQKAGAIAWSVTERRGLGPAKVTVDDYDFEAPSAAILKTQSAAKVLGAPTDSSGASGEGSPGAWASTAEIYNFPAKYTNDTKAAADRYSAVWLDAHRRRMARTTAQVRLFAAAVGRRLTLNFAGGASTEYLIVGTTHRYVGGDYYSSGGGEELDGTVELMPAADQYRPEMRTPRPRIPGPQTALVVGPSGEEIFTDKYGRIKVQFPWDRAGKKDQNSSCFIRVVQAASGQNWGTFALPRIGQEVVVEFLEGDPDRPLVTGTVYNANNMTPATLPDNKTQFGMKSRITKGGGGYNRLWFEDKKGAEVVWFRAERDYDVNIVHKDETRVYDEGNRTTTFKAGNDTLTIQKGTRTATIQGNDTLTIKQGNRSTKLELGNDTLKIDVGSHKTDAMQSIELVCGQSSIKLDPVSITLKSVMIKIDAQAMLEEKSAMIQSEGQGMHIIKGGLVMIN